MVTNINNHENSYIPYRTTCSEDFERVIVGGLKRVTFREFVTLQRGFDLPKKNIKAGIYPVVGSTSIIGYHAEFKANPPGVVIGRSGSLGSVLYVSDKYWPHNTSLWVRDFKGNIPKYVYYFLQTLELQRYDSGAAVPTLNRNHLDSLELRIHDLSTQRKIAALLGNYDDLIENNTRRIKILEEMSGTIYREWFIEFRFPGHENAKKVESELGLIPQGWEVKKVKQLVKRLKTGQIYTQTDVKDTGKVIVVDQSRADILGFHDKEPDHYSTPKNPIVTFGDHTCKMQLMITPFSLGPNVVPFIARDEMPINYLFFQVSNLVETREYKRHWTDLNNKEVVVADSQTRKQFSDVLIPTFQLIEVLNQKNRNLRQTRDLLLPKLISGELDVSDLDINTDTIQSSERNSASSDNAIAQ